MTREEEEARDRLLFHLENQTGFWFALVVGDDPRPRARLREAAEAFCREHNLAFTLHSTLPQQLSAIAADLAKGERQGLHWIRADGPQALIAQWETAARDLLLAMNERREAYRRRLNGGVIIEGRESLKRLLRDLAPDLFSIRAFIAEPGINAQAERPPILEWREPVRAGLFVSSVFGDPDRELERATRLTAMAGVGAQRAGHAALVTGVLGLMIAGRAHEADQRREELSALAEHLERTPDDANVTRFLSFVRLALGLVAADNKRLEEARKHLDEALSLIDTLVEREGDAVTFASAWACSEILQALGRVLAGLGDLPGSVVSLRKRLDIVESLAAANESNQEMMLFRTIASRELVDVLRKTGDLGSAEDLLRKMAVHEERYAAEQPAETSWLYELFWCRRVLGQVLAERGDLAGALEESQAALRVAGDIVERELSDEHLHLQLWLTYQQIIRALSAQNDWSNALATTEQVLCTIKRELGRRLDDEMWNILAVVSYTQRAEILYKAVDVEGTKVAILPAWTHTRQLPPGTDFDLPLYSLIELHIDLGVEQETVGSAEQVGLFKRAVKLGQRAVAAAPRDPMARRQLALAYKLLSICLLALGRNRAARKLRRKARALRRRR